MRLYLTKYTINYAEYRSIEDGYTKLVISRDGYPSGEDLPKVITVDYWEAFDD